MTKIWELQISLLFPYSKSLFYICLFLLDFIEGGKNYFAKKACLQFEVPFFGNNVVNVKPYFIVDNIFAPA